MFLVTNIVCQEIRVTNMTSPTVKIGDSHFVRFGILNKCYFIGNLEIIFYRNLKIKKKLKLFKGNSFYSEKTCGCCCCANLKKNMLFLLQLLKRILEGLHKIYPKTSDSDLECMFS